MTTPSSPHAASGADASTRRVAVIGLGSMGFGMALSLKRAGLRVVGCDMRSDVRQRFLDEGGEVAATPAEAARDADIVVCVVVNAAQTEAVLFADDGAAATMPEGSVFISSATMDPQIVVGLAKRLEATGRLYLDAADQRRGAACRGGGADHPGIRQPGGVRQGTPRAGCNGGQAVRARRCGGAGRIVQDDQSAAGRYPHRCCVRGDGLRRQAGPRSPQGSTRSSPRRPAIRGCSRIAFRTSSMATTRRGAQSISSSRISASFRTWRAARSIPFRSRPAALQTFLMAAGSGLGGEDDASVARIYARLTGTSLPGDGEEQSGSSD